MEFLRKTYDGNGSITGYLNRSIPNTVITDYQNEEMERIDPLQTVKAISSQAGKILRRGAPFVFAKALEGEYHTKWGRYKGNTNNKPLSKHWLGTSVVQGGAGMSFLGKSPRIRPE